MSDELPEGWTKTTLAEVCEFFTDGDWVESKDQDPNGEVRLIQLADIGDGRFLDKSNRFLTAQTANDLRCSLLAPGDLLIARMADPIARCCLFPGLGQPAATVVDVSIARAREGVDQTFLSYAVSDHSFRELALGAASGTTRSRISRSNLGALPIRLPPSAEQQNIAKVLRSADDALATYAAITTAASNVVQRLSSLYFTDPAAYEGPHPLGSFGELFDIKGGSQPPKSTFVYEPKPGFVRLLQIRDFERDDKAAYISESSSGVRCWEDDILIARYGASVGRILTGKSGAYNVALTKVEFRNDEVSRRYTYHWLRSDYFQNRIAAVSARSAQAGFNKEDLFPTKIVLPPLEEQRTIADTLDDLEKQVSVSERARSAVLQLKSSLLSDLLSGRVRVPA